MPVAVTEKVTDSPRHFVADDGFETVGATLTLTATVFVIEHPFASASVAV